MGLPQAVSTMREYKILKRLRVTPVSPVFILGVELTMYIVYCSVSLAVAGRTGCAFLACPPARLAAAFPRQPRAMQKIVSLFPLTPGNHDDEKRLHRRGYG